MDYRQITVLTGKFRKFHDGHLHLLTCAYNLKNPVVVLLNSDKGILKLGSKTIGAPFLKRKETIMKTGLVKNVLWFYTDPTNLLSFLRPLNVIAGHDHTKEEIFLKGGAFVKNIIIIQRIKNLSASKLLRER